jgi:hypothetical protein
MAREVANVFPSTILRHPKEKQKPTLVVALLHNFALTCPPRDRTLGF